MYQSRRCRKYLTEIDFEDGTGYSFGYTSNGLMTSMTNPRGLTSTHRFDDASRVIGTEDPESKALGQVLNYWSPISPFIAYHSEAQKRPPSSEASKLPGFRCIACGQLEIPGNC